MQNYFDVVQDQHGNAIPGASVTVLNANGTPATLFSDNVGTPAANPLTTNADGEYSFFAANGRYSLTIQATGYTPQTKTGIILFDPAESSASNDINFIQAGVGAVVRTAQAKMRETVSVEDFGAVGDGVTNDTAAINAAIAAVNDAGGGTVVFGPKTYATTGITLGTGDVSGPSTRDNRVRLEGAGLGSSTALINQQVNAATRLLYIGSPSTSAAVVTLAGPMYGVEIDSIGIDCDAKAGTALRIIHATQCTFTRIVARNYTSVGYDLTTRASNPVGAAFGTADNLFLNCFGFLDVAPAGNVIAIKLNSGVSTASSLAGQPDTARCTFIGGTYFYGQTASSYGIWLSGADNNFVQEVLFFPYAGSTSGFDVYFEQWPGSPAFPLENYFTNIGMTRGVSGNGGVGSTWGNTFYPFPTSDGAPLPSITGASGGDHLGRAFVAGQRAWRGRQISQVSSTTSRTTTSTSFGDITDYSVTLTTRADTKLKVTLTLSAAKSTAGQAFFGLALNGSDFGPTQQQIGATGFFAPVASTYVFDVGAGSQTITARFRSSDGNTVTVDRGVMIVEELY